MSEMKPVAYTSQIDLDRVRNGKSGDIYGSQKWEGSDDAVFLISLYTADQLAEAVAAERERCAKVCEAINGNPGGLTGFFLNKAAAVIRNAAP